MFRKKHFIIWSMLAMLMYCSIAYAEDVTEKDEGTIGERTVLHSIEYYYPVEADRNIKTVNINTFIPFAEIKSINTVFHYGLTGTYATGDITQLEGSLANGTLREVNYDTKAFGIGPGILADVGVFNMGDLSLHLSGSGSIIFYDRDFPAGGDQYNFMWRGGPGLAYAIEQDQTIGIVYNWMHVSNGQGMGDQNPSYNAEGVTLLFAISY